MSGKKRRERPAKFPSYGADAERLYVEHNLPLTTIAQMLPVAHVTLRAWRQKGEWEAKRKAHNHSFRQVAHIALVKLSEFLDILKKRKGITPAEVDALFKLVATIEKLHRRSLSLDYAIQFMEELTEFLKVEHPEKVKDWSLILPKFAHLLWQKYRPT